MESGCIETENHNIKAINSDTVHKICSGQVVFSLAVAVKELLENSLDAGATNVDIRLKNYGIDLIEVCDNGYGVTEESFNALTLKYHTSKLSNYSDLLGVSSFGFRGEALSSLCSLANLTITTRHKNSKYATKIEYDHKGNIVHKTPCSRQVGTTVILTNLFCTLPVRQKEFHKNCKREFNKMTTLLYAYCIISKGVRITCSNQTNSNSKNVVVATSGSTSYKDNIASVFGIKQLQSIVEIKTEVVSSIKDNIFKGLSGDVKESDEEINIQDVDISEDSNDAAPKTQDLQNESFSLSQKSNGHKNINKPVKLEGFISLCEHGSGRSSTDRQYYYVNARPCEPTKVMKIVNETYRQYNPNQYPFIFLNINMDRVSVDVNVTPDKRKVFLTKEKIILDIIKASLLKLFESVPRTLKVKSFNTSSANIDQPRIFTSFLQQDIKMEENNDHSSESSSKGGDLKRKSTTNLENFISKTKRSYEENFSDKSLNLNVNNPNIIKENKQELCTSTDISDIKGNELIITENNGNEKANSHDNFKEITVTESKENKDTIYLEGTENLPNTQIRSISDIVCEKSQTIYCKTKTYQNLLKEKSAEKGTRKLQIKPEVRIVTDREELGRLNNYRKNITIKTNLEKVRALTQIYRNSKSKTLPVRLKFRSAIDPTANKKCEEELSREITKNSFAKMRIVGQFNLGFIITHLDDDLFIIDQHATDEIYNFETLQKTTELSNQKLVIPQQLELTGVNEQILINNLDVFKKNGFTFQINENALPTKRVQLLTIPMSKNWIFGKDDIEELLFMLKESESEHYRPSRVRAMFASRACRKSVMIGMALSKADMRLLIDHMAEIEKPWNCPHGRPTIRHLVNLSMVYTR